MRGVSFLFVFSFFPPIIKLKYYCVEVIFSECAGKVKSAGGQVSLSPAVSSQQT